MIGHYTIRACILFSEGPYFRTPMARRTTITPTKLNVN